MNAQDIVSLMSQIEPVYAMTQVIVTLAMVGMVAGIVESFRK
jgi:hypothetical protein